MIAFIDFEKLIPNVFFIKVGIIILLLINVFPFLYATDDLRVISAKTHILYDVIIFSVKIENTGDKNIYILLDYVLQRLEYQGNKTVFALLSSEPYPLQYDGYYVHDFPMPNFNIVSPGQRQLFHIIINGYTHNLNRNNYVMHAFIEGLRYFVSEPPNYNFWGTVVSNYNYGLYSEFYRENFHSFDTVNLLGGL